MDRFGGMSRVKDGCKGWVNSVIIKVITDVITCMHFLKYKYNVKACMYTISALYQMINLNVST